MRTLGIWRQDFQVTHNSQDMEKPECPSTDELTKEMWNIAQP